MGHCLGGCCWSGAGGCSLASEGSRPPRMREVELGWGKALLVKDSGELHALGHKCPHYGAPLVKGEVRVPTGAPSAGGGLRGRGHGTRVPLEPGLCWWPSPVPSRSAVPWPGPLPLARRLLQRQHRGPGGLPGPGQSAQVPGGAWRAVG